MRRPLATVLLVMSPFALVEGAMARTMYVATATSTTTTPAPKTGLPKLQPPAVSPASPCESLRAGISVHIETMKKLNTAIQSRHQKPDNIERMWDPKAPMEEEGKLVTERRIVEQIAALLPPNKCPPLDIDAELLKPPAPPPKASGTSTPKKSKHKIF